MTNTAVYGQGMVYIEVQLGKSNIDELVNFIEALTPPADTPANVTPAEAYRAGYVAGQAAARRLVIDMWNAAEIVQTAEQDIYGELNDKYGY